MEALVRALVWLLGIQAPAPTPPWRALLRASKLPRDILGRLRWLMVLGAAPQLVHVLVDVGRGEGAGALRAVATFAVFGTVAVRARDYFLPPPSLRREIVEASLVLAIAAAFPGAPYVAIGILFNGLLLRALSHATIARTAVTAAIHLATMAGAIWISTGGVEFKWIATLAHVPIMAGAAAFFSRAIQRQQVAVDRAKVVASAGAALASASSREELVRAAFAPTRALTGDAADALVALALSAAGGEADLAIIDADGPGAAALRGRGLALGPAKSDLRQRLDEERHAVVAAADRELVGLPMGPRPVLLIPMTADQQMSGLLVIESRAPFDRGQLEALKTLGTTVALFLARVALNEERMAAVGALHESELKLRDAQRLEAIGRLAGGIAHDFNNVLSCIMAYTSLLYDGTDEQDPRRLDVDEIRNAAERATALTGQLLAFGRRQVLQTTVVDVSATVQGMENMLRRLIGEDVELATSYGAEPCHARVDVSRLEQVIANLVVNARDSMPTGGRIHLATALVPAKSCQEEGKARRYDVLLTVSDTGSGMTDDVRARIFEPFFTTKERGKGTGLGLATVYGIVTQSDGEIEVDSKLGRGSTFRVRLPAMSGIGAATERSGPVRRMEEIALTGTETILLVDDEDAIRRGASRILRRQGYTVLEARNAGEALLIHEQRGQEIDVVVTDVIMPLMNGRQLVERLLAQNAELKIVYMSAYSDEPISRHGLDTSKHLFLPKPFAAVDLARIVRRAIDGVVEEGEIGARHSVGHPLS